jgi:hypothetical protein
MPSPLLETPEFDFQTWPPPALVAQQTRSPPISPPRRASKFTGLFQISRAASQEDDPITRATSPVPRRSTSVPALRALARMTSRGTDVVEDEEDINPAEISRVLTPDEDPFAKRDVDIIPISPKSRMRQATQRPVFEAPTYGGGIQFSDPFESASSPPSSSPSALGLFDAVDPFSMAPHYTPSVPSAWRAIALPTPAARVIPPTPVSGLPSSSSSEEERPLIAKFGKSRQLFVPDVPSPQRRGSAPMVGVGAFPVPSERAPRERRGSFGLKTKWGGHETGAASETERYTHLQLPQEDFERGRSGTSMSHRKMGFRERLGSAFRLGFGGSIKQRPSSPVASASSSFVSRDIHGRSRLSVIDSPRSSGLFPFASTSSVELGLRPSSAFITPMPSPSRLSRSPMATLMPMPRRQSTLEIPIAPDAHRIQASSSLLAIPTSTSAPMLSSYGAAICPLQRTPSPDSTAQLMSLVESHSRPATPVLRGLTPPPERSQNGVSFGPEVAAALRVQQTHEQTLSALGEKEARGGLLRKDELFALENALIARPELDMDIVNARKGSFPFQAARQRSLGELDLMFSPRDRASGNASYDDEDQDGDSDSWQCGARERWERSTEADDESRRSSTTPSIATSVYNGEDEEEGNSGLIGDVTTDALHGLGLELALGFVSPEFIDPWTRTHDRGVGAMRSGRREGDVSTIASSEGTEDSYNFHASGAWPMPPSETTSTPILPSFAKSNKVSSSYHFCPDLQTR